MSSSTNDPISDMLTRLRNASLRKNKKVLIPKTKLTLKIAKILQIEGYLRLLKPKSDDKEFCVKLDYDYQITQNQEIISRLASLKGKRKSKAPLQINKDPVLVSRITGLKRISKPGLRVYSEARKMPKVLGGLGIAIISTSKGLMTDRLARAKGLGGEVLCYVW